MKKIIIVLIVLSIVVLSGCNLESDKELCKEFKIKIIANIEQDYDETDRYIESDFCCNLDGHCDNCLTEKGALWLWGLIENTTGAHIDVEYIGCVEKIK